MTTYQDYLNAVERLRRVTAGEHPTDVYGINMPPISRARQHWDKAIIYDAEHDPTPATVEWCKEIGFEHYAGVECPTYELGSLRATLISGVLMLCHGNSFRLSDNPTCGDVLTLLRVFNERKV